MLRQNLALVNDQKIANVDEQEQKPRDDHGEQSIPWEVLAGTLRLSKDVERLLVSRKGIHCQHERV